jgi:hypothetical protein
VQNSWTIWRRFLSTICKNNNEHTTNNKNNNNNNNNNNNKESNTATEDKFSIGTTITKHWGGVPYTGTVTSNTDKYYKIRYEDNDEEELNHSEVAKYMKKHGGEGTTTEEIGQRMRLKKRLGDWNTSATTLERI